ncbi:HCO3 transporter family-domain-containing protein [Lipomyces tetrasporus]
MSEMQPEDKPLRPFRLLRQDFRHLSQRYVSDWTTFNQLIVASAVFVFFSNLLPGLTFANDLYVLTDRTWGTIEVIFSTGLCGYQIAANRGLSDRASAQPLTILGVTGPFCILAENLYSLCESSFGIPFLPFMAWSLIHAAWMHYLLAIFNAHNWTMRYVTTFTTEIFSLLNSVIYFHKAIQELQRVHSQASFASFLYAIIGTVGTLLVAIFLSTAERWKPLFHRYIRMGLSEYAAAISIIIFIGLPHAGELATLDRDTLYISSSFRPTNPERTIFFVQFWHLPVSWAFAAIIPGCIITILFFFDHEISSVICTEKRFGTRKPGGPAWDIFLLGTTIAMCGILGIPPANGLLPQAPLHSQSLLHREIKNTPSHAVSEEEKSEPDEYDTVYEQRWSHFLHAGGILCFVSPPLMHVLGLTPTSVLAGLFLFMGEQSLSLNPILFRVFYLLTPSSELPGLPEGITGYLPIHLYTIFQVLITAGIFVVTLTKAGPAFPVLIIALIPLRLTIMRRVWRKEILRYVDQWASRDGTPEDMVDEERVTQLQNGDIDQDIEGVGIVQTSSKCVSKEV